MLHMEFKRQLRLPWTLLAFIQIKIGTKYWTLKIKALFETLSECITLIFIRAFPVRSLDLLLGNFVFCMSEIPVRSSVPGTE